MECGGICLGGKVSGGKVSDRHKSDKRFSLSRAGDHLVECVGWEYVWVGKCRVGKCRIDTNLIKDEVIFLYLKLGIT